jgi:hypothetical protein
MNLWAGVSIEPKVLMSWNRHSASGSGYYHIMTSTLDGTRTKFDKPLHVPVAARYA